VRSPGTRLSFGLDSILGLLPAGGDIAGGLVSCYALVLATRLGAPPSVIVRMVLNIGIDTLVGTVPLLGDLFDVGWKANRKNLLLLERYETAPEAVRRSSVGVVILALVLLIALLVAAAMFGVWIISQLIHLVKQ
jgi:hypothetical protein